MQDLVGRLRTLSRPRLLSRAARIGAAEYRRARDLKRLLGPSQPNRQGLILMRLLELEADQDRARRCQSPGYSILRHVEVLIAIAAESQIYLATGRQGDPQKARARVKTAPAAAGRAPHRNGRNDNGTGIDAAVRKVQIK